MQLVEILGPREILQTLLGVEGLELSIQSARHQSENVWRVSGYATDSAIEELRRRGCRVTTIMSSEEVNRGIERGRGRREPR